MIDQVEVTPCSDAAQDKDLWGDPIPVPTCKKPLYGFQFPGYTATTVWANKGAEPFPISAFKTISSPFPNTNLGHDNELNLLKVDRSKTIEYPPSIGLTSINLCDLYGGSDGVLDTDGYNRNGQPIRTTPPLDPKKTKSFCENQRPFHSFVWTPLTQGFDLPQLCPFIGDGSSIRYCIIFYDHGTYPTVSALLTARLPPSAGTWAGVMFLYSPVSQLVFQRLYYAIQRHNVLFTNYIYGRQTRYPFTDLPSLFDGESLLQRALFRPFQNLFAQNPLLAKALFTKVMGIDIETTESEPTPLLEAVAIVSAAVEYLRVGTEYELPISYGSGTVRYADDIYNACVADEGCENELTTAELVAADQVRGKFREISTSIPYDDVTLMPLLNRTEARELLAAVNELPHADSNAAAIVIGSSKSQLKYGVSVCTRYQLSGTSQRISGLVFDQSLCSFAIKTAVITPVIFSGASAEYSVITNCTVIDAPTAVAVLGADAFAYRYAPFINATGLAISDIRFIYTDAQSSADHPIMLQLTERNVIAALGRTVGDKITIDGTRCQLSAASQRFWESTEETAGSLSGSGASSSGSSGLSNDPCFVLPRHLDSTANVPDICIGNSRCLTLNGAVLLPCCSGKAPTRAADCAYGLRCSGDTLPPDVVDTLPICNLRFCAGRTISAAVVDTAAPDTAATGAIPGCGYGPCVPLCLYNNQSVTLGYTNATTVGFTNIPTVIDQWYIASETGPLQSGLVQLRIDGASVKVVESITQTRTDRLLRVFRRSDGIVVGANIPGTGLRCIGYDHATFAATVVNCTDNSTLLVSTVPTQRAGDSVSDRIQLAGTVGGNLTSRVDLCLVFVGTVGETDGLMVATCSPCSLAAPTVRSDPQPVSTTTGVWWYDDDDRLVLLRHYLASAAAPTTSSSPAVTTTADGTTVPGATSMSTSSTTTTTTTSTSTSSTTTVSEGATDHHLYRFGATGRFALKLAPGNAGCYYENDVIGPCSVDSAFINIDLTAGVEEYTVARVLAEFDNTLYTLRNKIGAPLKQLIVKNIDITNFIPQRSPTRRPRPRRS